MSPEVAADRGTTALRRAMAAGVCLALVATGCALVARSDGPPLDVSLPPFVLPGLLLAAYVFSARATLDFEVRGNAHSVTLGQLPLALGVLLVPPWVHLAACTVASLGVALARRQHVLKTAYNVGAATFEVGLVAFVVHLAASDGRPSLGLWLALGVALVLADNIGSLALTAVWWLLRMDLDAAQVLHPLALGAATATAATATAVVTVSAAYTEPVSIVIMLLLGAIVGWAYRRYRLLRAQQAAMQDLYRFVRDLGPVDSDDPNLLDVVERVRDLLHAERLDLLVPHRAGHWDAVVARDGARPERWVREPPAQPGRDPSQPRSPEGRLETMTTTLFGSAGVLGVLTARDRLGDVRDFDLGDVRMLETVAAELATALERGRLLADLRRSATTDALTGLPNLAEATRRLDAMLTATGDAVVVAVASVESFRDVNETLGHAVGDALLVEAGRRLTAAAPPGALLGRIGGARFAVAMPAASDEDGGHLVALGLRSSVEGEARVGPVGTQIRLSVGVARAPHHGTDARTLLRRAETAMSSARSVAGGPVAWAPAYEVEGQRRLAVLSALREAVATGAIGLAFQPKVDVRTGAISGVEALARWTHPALGDVTPGEFIPLAEASGFIGPLTSTVLRQAATAAQGWQGPVPGVGVAVNVSADTVLDPAFVTEVGEVLTASGLAADLLTLELTEGVVVSDPALAVERLGELRALGVRIAVDDFGTGYSSLTYLKGLPVDEVKIDKTFVRGVGMDHADDAVVRAVVDIAHAMHLRVVAEGVEISRQHDALAALGADVAQGYLHGRPMPATAIAAWLRSRAVTPGV